MTDTNAPERTLLDVYSTLLSGEFYSDYDQSASDLGIIRRAITDLAVSETPSDDHQSSLVSVDEAQPVAWRGKHMHPGSENWVYVDGSEKPATNFGSLISLEPLFAHPAPSAKEATNVLHEVIEWAHDQTGNYPDWFDRARKAVGLFEGDAGNPAPIQCYEVKPLEWRGSIAETPFGNIIADVGINSTWYGGMQFCRGDHEGNAKAKAQSDYEKRILSALTLRSVEDVRREAFEEAAAIKLDMEVHLHDGRMAHRETVEAYRAAIRQLAEKP